MCPIGISLVDGPIKIVMPHAIICFHIHAQFLQTQATRLYLCFQLLLIQIL